MTTDEKTPPERPATVTATVDPTAAAKTPDESIDGPRGLARVVGELREAFKLLKDLPAKVEALIADHSAMAAKVIELIDHQTAVSLNVDAHSAELSEVHDLIETIASAGRKREAQRPASDVRHLPSPVPGLELAAIGGEIAIDTSQPGTHLTQLPGGGIVEVNVRRPDGPMVRDGKPVPAGKGMRRS